jgi:hypothetical protein
MRSFLIFDALMSHVAHTAVQEREGFIEASVLVRLVTSQNGFYLLLPPESVLRKEGWAEGEGGGGDAKCVCVCVCVFVCVCVCVFVCLCE